MKQKITKTLVESLLPPVDKSQLFIRDSVLQGFALRITSSGTKSFIVEKRVKRKNSKSRNCRATIGVYPQIKVAKARERALQLLSEMTLGVDINKQNKIDRRKLSNEQLTLSQVLDDYLIARKNLKPRTISDYRLALMEAMPDWFDQPMSKITKDVVAKIHSKRGKDSKARADNSMRVLRALFNFAAEKYSDDRGDSVFAINPVTRLSNTKAWYNVPRKQTVIKSHELSDWFEAVYALEEDNPNSHAAVISDFLLFTLFNGLRRTEALTIKCKYFDLEDKSFRLPDTKNGRAHILPLTDYSLKIVQRRLSERVNEYLFPSISGVGHLVDARRQMEKVIKWSGIKFTLHDLRRTFATTAESLDIPYYALKCLLNHKLNSDVTAGYVVTDINRLRAPMDLIADELVLQSTNISGDDSDETT